MCNEYIKKEVCIYPEKGIAEIIDTQATNLITYGQEYFNTYFKLKGTKTSDLLMKGRCDLVNKYCTKDKILDIGCGAGDFIDHRPNTYGYDINVASIEMLEKQGKYIHLFQMLNREKKNKKAEFKGYSFWDSLEHIPNIQFLINQFQPGSYIFVSIPIFKDIKSIFTSKHYKPNEHLIYFTKKGLINWMYDIGYIIQEVTDFEIQAGREDILSFVFLKELNK